MSIVRPNSTLPDANLWRSTDLPPDASSATFARWRTGPLLVTAADDAVQRWSTDPRSGVPPMPDLTGPEPECLGLTVDGVDTSNPVA